MDKPKRDDVDLYEIERQIAKKTNGSLAYAILGIWGVASLVFCPLVIIRTRQAMRLMDEYGVGEGYRGRAKVAFWIATLVLSLWILVFVVIVLSSLFARR